jgi:hypothetical protein
MIMLLFLFPTLRLQCEKNGGHRSLYHSLGVAFDVALKVASMPNMCLGGIENRPTSNLAS